VQALLNELEMMARLQHPNIVNFVEYFLHDDSSAEHHGACVIVMNLLEGPDMMDYLDEARGFSRGDAQVRTCWSCHVCARCVLLDSLDEKGGSGRGDAQARHLGATVARQRVAPLPVLHHAHVWRCVIRAACAG
jgi:serine/threonine protein kinase